MLTHSLVALLTLAPTPDIAAPLQIDHVETIAAEDAQIVAYDHNGAVVGSLAAWQDTRGGFHLVADYGDGFAHTIIVDGVIVSHESNLDAATLSHRNLLVVGGIDSNDAQAGWVHCGLFAGATIAWAASGNAIGGAASAVLAYCACAEVIEKIDLPKCD